MVGRGKLRDRRGGGGGGNGAIIGVRLSD